MTNISGAKDYSQKSFVKRLLMITKLITFLLLVNLSTVSAGGFAQTVTLRANNITLLSAMRTIKKQTGHPFFLKGKDLAEIRKDVDINQLPLKEALDKLLNDLPAKWVMEEGTVVIKPASFGAPSGAIERTNNNAKAMFVLDKVISGKVIDENGNGLEGVSVTVKGTNVGTTTDANGAFSLRVEDNVRLLVFSIVGYTTIEREVRDNPILNVSLQKQVTGLNEVVVTALGISKEIRSLSYSMTQVDGESFQKAREINLGDALAGKIAGVDATSASTGPGSSSRVVIRGNGSLNGDNQPLYVINGIPIINNTLSNPGAYGGIDGGDGLSSINPDDIESISVLKGGTAAALYGSRAANGVILITTKSGRSRKGIGVELSSTSTFQVPYSLLDWQYEYGSGQRGTAPTSKAEAIANGRLSWGAKLDGSPVVQFDGVERPYIAQKDNLQNFYQNGKTFTNTLSINGGSELINFRFSVSDLNNSAVVPNSTLDIKTFTLSVQGNLKNKIIYQGDVLYSIQSDSNRVSVGDFQRTPNSNVGLIATNVDIRNLSPGYDENGFEVPWSDYIYATNPYFAINKFKQADLKRRLFSSFRIRYNILKFLYLQAKAGIDQNNLDYTDITPTGTAFNNRGQMSSLQMMQTETNVEGIIGFDKAFGDFSVNGFAGGNQMKRTFNQTSLNSGFFNVPFQYFIGNGTSQTFSKSFNESAINSLYGSLDISYKNYLYLSATSREDWFSTLYIENNHIFYPSVGLSYVLTSSLKSVPSWITYGKLRASWAQVGGGAPNPYGLDLTYSPQAQQYQGQTLMTIAPTVIPNKLKPYTSTTYEAGTEWKFFNSKFGVDLTLYQRTTTDDIVNASIPISSSYSAIALNVGKVQNRGIELLLSGTPVILPDGIRWDVSYNLGYNKNVVLAIAPELGLDVLALPGATTRTLNGQINHYVGQPFGMVSGNTLMYNNEKIIYNSANGVPIPGPTVAIAPGVAPWVMGLNNNLSYKNFSLSFLVDAKYGGYAYSATEAYGTFYGLDKRTVANNVRETGVTVDGVDQHGNPYHATIPVQTYFQGIALSITEWSVQKTDYINLRQVVFGFDMPQKWIRNTPIQALSVSFVARDLLFLYNGAKLFDPASSFNNTNAQGLESFGVPPTRSFGINLDIKF